LRYLVLGDIHGNLQALTRVLESAGSAGFDRVLCAGDVVGYGANPHECLEAVREAGALVVAGNHDWAAIDRVNIDYFNADARDSIQWTREHLTPGDLEYLAGLPLVATDDGITICHSSPFSPEYFDYIQTLYDVRLAFDHLETRIGFVGHSHVPVMFMDGDPASYFLRPELEVPDEGGVMVNVGSVGQPRDLDPRACYAVYDTDQSKVCLYRVEYDLHAASALMVTEGLPTSNAARIVLGR
jgi:diadenosine tetraphosphatase ApaH/serine/threonine PP2A family protein phosphatase